MTLGLPGHLVQSTLSRALARASHWFGLTCLAAAVLTVSILSATGIAPELWLTSLVMVAMAVLLVALAKYRTLPLTLAYLAAGTAASYFYTLHALGVSAVFPTTDLFLLALPKLALVMVGGVGSATFTGVLWSTAGFVLAEAATAAAIAQTPVPYRADWFTISAYLLLVGILLMSGVSRRGAVSAAQLSLHRAVQDDATRTLRADLDNRAIALLNDTTVSALVALARARPGPVPPHLLASIRSTMHTLTETNWLTDVDTRASRAAAPGTAPDRIDWLASSVYRAVDHCRDRGLVVTVAGDRAALKGLDSATDRELGLAVQQCLVNVILHAGIVSADVQIDADRLASTLSLMVTDAGRGFTESESASDRLGLRQSVRRRIERLGGSVEIWTRPGAGTSVLLTVPLASDIPAHRIDWPANADAPTSGIRIVRPSQLPFPASAATPAPAAGTVSP
ncbi:ATP-binding protein [Cryobacterium frigoriphilum]|uniref:ATP-binding protein n=1 Tax=Cryobacterium frigoriphilum TaxID=1259150 RepID=A0A4R8ZTW5_9MICO|nr:ATP-binding protein [Cryobacterium frigoriphilum]TFD45346.1 ATP-binding protein [Cryobacterium frigoriphilum]